MKKITLTLITVLLFGVKTINAQEQELIASEPISSGCLSENFIEEADCPTIKLTKEGSILAVDLFGYESNCGTTGFDVENRLSVGNDGTPTVVISLVPIVPASMDCHCPFNISYTVRDFEVSRFNLLCWWFDGLVELTDGEPLVLEYKTEDVVIDDMKFTLLKTTHQAKLTLINPLDAKVEIPSEVEYEGEKYSVTSIFSNAFGLNTVIKQITIPKTVKNGDFGSIEDISGSSFSRCLSLETIEVDEGNPTICSIDGVLFNKDKTTLIAYPVGSPRESYTVPDCVKTVGGAAFYNSQHLKKIVLPDNVEAFTRYSTFRESKSLEEVILSSNIKELPIGIFRNCTKLKSVVIPEGITTIGSSIFEGCSSLESISLPESVVTVGNEAFWNCTSLKRVILSPNLEIIPNSMFRGCRQLSEIIIPSGITTINCGAFSYCEAIQSLELPESIDYIAGFAFRQLLNLKDIYCHTATVPNTDNDAFRDTDLSQATLHVPAASIADYEEATPWNQFGAIVPLEAEMAYRPFVEEDKVWKVGVEGSGNPVQWVEHYYFDGDTIIGGKTCKQMMSQRFVSPDYPEYDVISEQPSLSYVGAWYEEDQKVYFCKATNQQFKLMYDFSLDTNDTLLIDNLSYVIGQKQTGGLKGFKGVYRNVWECGDGESIYWSTPWLEGVGGIFGPTINVIDGQLAEPASFLMACAVGDEVIYFNDEYEDGVTPEGANARKRFDFTHTIKIQPTSRMRSRDNLSLYGEYNNLQLGINLDPLDDAYLVRITDDKGKAVYENAVNAGNIVGLNIDISTYAEGSYTVTMENSYESFTGIFETQTSGIEVVSNKNEEVRSIFYNLQGQRLSSLQKGLNIVNGQKVYVK